MSHHFDQHAANIGKTQVKILKTNFMIQTYFPSSIYNRNFETGILSRSLSCQIYHQNQYLLLFILLSESTKIEL